MVLAGVGLVLILVALKLPGRMASAWESALLPIATWTLRVLVEVPQVVGTQVC